MGLTLQPVYRNLRTRVTFLGLEAEDLFCDSFVGGCYQHPRPIPPPRNVRAAMNMVFNTSWPVLSIPH